VSTTTALAVTDLHVYLGESHVLQGVSFSVAKGGVTALLGRNGVGKTTTLRALMGLVPRSRGTVELEGADVTRLPTHAIVRRGVGYVPEDRDVFAGLTVEENLRLSERGGNGRYDLVYDLFPELKDRGRQRAGTLSGGQQQMVAIGRALMARPRIVLFDEPSLGLAPTIVDDMFDIIARVRQDGAAVLLVEQNVLKALDVADRAYVLEQGRIVSTGLPADLLQQPHIREAYLGV
jgi:branched-chain amino acid transport system ATP-binding protein